MKKSIKLFNILFFLFLIIGCSEENDTDDLAGTLDYRAEMRSFVGEISGYAKSLNPDFIIIPQNGHELLMLDEASGTYADDYISSIDGVGREDLYFGYDDDDIATPGIESEYMITFMDLAETNGVQVLVTDYCSTQWKMDSSYAWNNSKGYISFAADRRELDNIPVYPAAAFNVNSDDVLTLADADNFLYLLNTDQYNDKAAFLSELQASDYDLFIIDLFFSESIQLTAPDIESLKIKPDGGQRLVIAYMSIGEAEDYRYYWMTGWTEGSPDWIVAENPNWQGNYKVKYWDTEWQEIISGNNDSYLMKIIDSQFNGVYLDIIDAYEYFE